MRDPGPHSVSTYSTSEVTVVFPIVDCLVLINVFLDVSVADPDLKRPSLGARLVPRPRSRATAS